ncbi:MAG: hypothetical protein CL891_00990 [Dehalococcoidia bacterium]|nr:hypothetical protein [Dehalococcoidia bacterium]|tara:strand:- start:64 stop:669 length:606 start_codon:yes stop_codon:yes gene_type:complete
MRLSRLTLLAALMILAALLTVCGGEESTPATTGVSSGDTSVGLADDAVEDDAVEDAVEDDAVEDDTSSSVVGELSEPSSTTEELFITANSSESIEVDLMAGDVLIVEIALEGHSTGGSRSDIGQAGVSTKVTVAVTNEYDEVIFMKAEVTGQTSAVIQSEGAHGEVLDAITIEETGIHTISVFNPLLLQGQSADLTININQ